MRYAGVVLLAAALLAAPAAALEVPEVEDLDSDLPTALDDAFAADAGGVEAQAALRYDRRRGHDTLRLLPQMQFGVVQGLQLATGLPYLLGSGPEARRGEATLDLLYTVAEQDRWLPAVAVAAGASTPIGPGARGTELRLTGIATRTLDAGAGRRLHLNLSWLHRANPGPEERRDRYRLVAGYSETMVPDTVLVLDYQRQRGDLGERASNILEAGLRHELRPGLLLGGAVGAGVGRDSPRFRAVLSVQWMLAGG